MPRSDIPQSLLGTEFTTPVHTVEITAECENKERMLHEGRTGKFVFYADEPPRLGGDDAHPQPLRYIAAGIGF